MNLGAFKILLRLSIVSPINSLLNLSLNNPTVGLSSSSVDEELRWDPAACFVLILVLTFQDYCGTKIHPKGENMFSDMEVSQDIPTGN